MAGGRRLRRTLAQAVLCSQRCSGRMSLESRECVSSLCFQLEGFDTRCQPCSLFTRSAWTNFLKTKGAAMVKTQGIQDSKTRAQCGGQVSRSRHLGCFGWSTSPEHRDNPLKRACFQRTGLNMPCPCMSTFPHTAAFSRFMCMSSVLWTGFGRETHAGESRGHGCRKLTAAS